MPALKSMANHENTPNSGRSSSRPSLMLPTLLNTQYTANSTNPVATRMYHQPTPSEIASLSVPKASSVRLP